MSTTGHATYRKKNMLMRGFMKHNAMMDRVRMIKSLLPQKQTDTLTGEIRDYGSERFRQIEELIDIAESLNSRLVATGYREREI